MGLSFESDRNIITSSLDEMAVYDGLVAYYTMDSIPEIPDDPTGRIYTPNWSSDTDNWGGAAHRTVSVLNNTLISTADSTGDSWVTGHSFSSWAGKSIIFKFKVDCEVTNVAISGGLGNCYLYKKNGYYYASKFIPIGTTGTLYFVISGAAGITLLPVTFYDVYVGNGNYLANSLLDNSGNNYHGTNYGSLITTGISSNALVFDGVSNYISLQNDILTVSAIRTNGITYSAWIKPEALGINGRIVGQQGYSGYSDYNSGGLGITSSNMVTMICYDENIGYKYVTSSTTLTTSSWYHIVGTYSSSDKYIRLYVNGIQEGTPLLITTFSVIYPNQSNRIGNKEHTNSYYFNGLIDEVRIYNRALSATEVKQLYKLNSPNNVASMKEE